jgi:hypothetical protein
VPDFNRETIIDFVNYLYGVDLANRGIGLSELLEDMPKTSQNADVMRGYRDTWRKRGYAQPPGLNDDA